MPLLKETRQSLRLYFVIGAGLLSPSGAEGYNVPMFVNMTFTVVYLYIAFRFEKLLPKPTWIKVVLVVSMAWTAISLAISLRSGVQVKLVATLILSLLLFVYLLKCVARLSAEVAPIKA